MVSAHCKELEDSGLAMARERIQTKKLKAKGQFITVQAKFRHSNVDLALHYGLSEMWKQWVVPFAACISTYLICWQLFGTRQHQFLKFHLKVMEGHAQLGIE